jgi:hypothetical protein
VQIYPLVYAPALDTTWDKMPGALRRLSSYAPLQSGNYGTMGYQNYFGSSTITGSDIYSAFITNQTTGSRRLLVFRATNIDEYDSSATRTNRATGLTTTTNWDVANFGNAVIAVSPENATQVSTSAGFSALAGAPKGKCVAANYGFVMIANYDDGTAVPDGWYCSAINDHTSWTTSIATQCANRRAVEISGPVTALAPFRDGFVLFKDNGFFVGNYINAPYVWDFVPTSYRVGCVSKHAWAECDGKLYFLHWSGVFEWDGANLRNVGVPVFDLIQQYMGLAPVNNTDIIDEAGTYVFSGVASITAAVDDLDGIVWFSFHATTASASQCVQLKLGYNVRSGKWGHGAIDSSAGGGNAPWRLVRASTADIQAFKSSSSARLLTIEQATTTTIQRVGYPTPNTRITHMDTGRWGGMDQSATQTKVQVRCVVGSTTPPTVSGATLCTAPTLQTPFVTSAGAVLTATCETTTTGSYNSELDELQFSGGYSNGRWKRLRLVWTTSSGGTQTQIVSGIGVDPPIGTRR